MAVNDNDDGATEDPERVVITGYFGGAPYREMAQMHEDLLGCIMKHSGTVPLMTVLGLLECIKHELLSEAMEG